MTRDTRILTTVQILDMLCDHYKYLSEDGKTPATDYRVAKELGVTTAAVSGWRTGKYTMDDETAIRVADVLGKEHGHLLACMLHERAKSSRVRDTVKLWVVGSANLLALAVLGFHAWPGV